MSKKLNTEEFIEKARLVHGDKYDYSKVLYKNSRTKVLIKHKKCNSEFWQTPAAHLSGRGCNCCKIPLYDIIGEENYNMQAILMKIIAYINARDITVEFQDDNKYKVETSYKNFKSGTVKNRFFKYKSFYGVGFLGGNEYKLTNENRKICNVWRKMLGRCYNNEIQKKLPSYIGCTVCNDWHNFQNFIKWYKINRKEVKCLKVEIDKDILVKGNKVYSPETCLLVPPRINGLITNCVKSKGNFPMGVSFDKKSNKFRTQVQKNGKRFVEFYETTNEAFLVYKTEKEKYIKEVADEYKDKIPQKLYDALYAYQIEITD